jgi:hypothetical protein
LTNVQAFVLGIMVVLTPSLIVLAFFLCHAVAASRRLTSTDVADKGPHREAGGRRELRVISGDRQKLAPDSSILPLPQESRIDNNDATATPADQR